MKSNSLNPVDGDVQALIADCQAEIAEIEKSLTTWGEAWIPYLQSKLKRQQVALAALKAEPGLFEWRFKETYTPASPFMALPMEKLERTRDFFGDLVEYRFWFPTPPAQLLRPVELPIKRRPWSCADSDNVLDYQETVTALRNQGYEVKS